MGLKRKDLELLFLLRKTPLTMGELQEKIGTSERNLRYVIENLNFYLDKILNKKIEKNKTKLSVSLNTGEIDSFIYIVYKNYYILEQEERVEYILLIFLLLKNPTLSFIEKKLNITRITLKKDIEVLNKKLSFYQLKLCSEKNRFYIQGNEKKLRHLKTLKLLQLFKIQDGKILFKDLDYRLLWLDRDFLFTNLYRENIAPVEACIRSIEKSFFIEFNKEFEQLMGFFLLVSLERIKLGHIINKKSNYDFLVKTPYYKIVEENLESLIPRDLKFELVHLTEYFISGGASENMEETEKSVHLFLENYIEFLKKSLLITINFNALKEDLKKYLVPAIYRLRNNFSIGSMGKKDEIYFLTESFSQRENTLPEALTEKEIYHISSLVTSYIEEENHKIISLNKLLEIIERNSKNIKKENLVKELLEEYGNIIRDDIYEKNHL